MQIDWNTLVLESINFLILLWILKRFLYAPVRAAIAKRQAAVADAQAHAAEALRRADALKQQYEGRMQAWERERETARAELDDELTQHRQHQLAATREAIVAEQEKNRVVQERRQREQARQLADRAAIQATRFAATLLDRLSGPGLDERIAEVVIEDLPSLPDDRRNALIEAAGDGMSLEICSAHPLSDTTFSRLQTAIREQLGQDVAISRTVDPQLRGGIRIALGPWLLEATLAHELTHFRQSIPSEG